MVFTHGSSITTMPGEISHMFCEIFHSEWTFRFAYVRTDSEGYATYSYQRSYNGQTLMYYLHFYDEGLFYNGFWVVNDLETGYVETTGRVFIYNSENDYCPEVSTTLWWSTEKFVQKNNMLFQSTYNYWYFWKNGDWVYNTGIYLETCWSSCDRNVVIKLFMENIDSDDGK